MYPLPLGYKTHAKDSQDVSYLIPETRTRHTALFGKSGVGKTTLMRNMVLWDIWNGSGVTVIDPHGQLIDDLLQHIPRSRTNDVIYFKPADLLRVASLNILEKVPRAYQPLVVSSIVSTFKALFSNGWGQQSEYLLTNFCFALIAQDEPTTLLDILRLITDADYREKIFRNVQDGVLQTFYRTYEHEWDDEQRAKASAPLLNKVSAFATNPLLRSVIGQPRSSFNFRDVLDEEKILLCDLSKGALGEDIASLLGSLITTKLYLASLSRQDTPEAHRIPHYFYIDEVHNFTHGIDLSSILAEARKYRLSLTVATQTLAQLRRHNDEIVASIFGNCGTLASFRVSGDDAVILAKEFASDVIATQLENLPDYDLYLRTLIYSQGSDALMASQAERLTAYPPFHNNKDAQESQRVIRASFERYTQPRAEVDAWISRTFAPVERKEASGKGTVSKKKRRR
jgi:type IV secretory pathway TraG/TraD family ATPase VirD4